MIRINRALIEELSKKARASGRKRCNYNFHKSYDEPVQRLLNVLERGTYIRPHKHEMPDKIEAFILLKGRVLALEFGDGGSIIESAILDLKSGDIGVEFPPRTWHSFIALEDDSVLYELKEGPFIEHTDKNFAEWAPAEGTKEALEFNEAIVKRLVG